MTRIAQLDLGDRPLFLAPMEDVTDSPFRRICKRFGADVLVTEFISSDGLMREAARSRMKMQFMPEERPVGIQIFGAHTDAMVRAAEVAEAVAPDFIDLNFGCPVRKVVMKGGGAALLQDIPKMTRMARAVVAATRLPVTVKTRLGWDSDHLEIVEVAEMLQDVGIAAIAIHGRTRAQLYGGEADWSLIGAVKNNPRMKIPVFGNGDIDSGPKALEMFQRYGVDGILIGRAAVGNPWIFRDIRHFLSTGELPVSPVVEERVRILREHLNSAVDYKGERATLLEIRKMYSGYFKGVPGMKPFRMKLMTTGSLNETLQVLHEIDYFYRYKIHDEGLQENFHDSGNA